MKFPGQTCAGLPLYKDGQKENLAESGGQEEGSSPGSPQRNPANNLPAPMLRKKTESALYGCAVLLASLTLGLDFRDLHRAQSPEELSPKEEEDEEGTLQCTSRSRARPCPSQPAAGREPSGAPSLPMLGVTDLSSRLSLSRRCPLQMGKDKPPTKNTQLTAESCSVDLEKSCQPISVPRLETEHSVLRTPSSALLEQSDENLPVCANTGDRALHHRWMVLDRTPFKSLSAPRASRTPRSASPGHQSDRASQDSPKEPQGVQAERQPRSGSPQSSELPH